MSTETLYIKDLCNKCKELINSGKKWSFQDLCNECQVKVKESYDNLLSKYNKLVRKYNELVEEYKSLSKEEEEVVKEYNKLVTALKSGSLSLKPIARGEEKIYVQLLKDKEEKTPIEGLLTTDLTFYPYGILSKEEIEKVKSRKVTGVLVKNTEEGEIVVGTYEYEPLREEAQIIEIKNDERGENWIRLRFSGNREFTKKYNPKIDRVPLEKLREGYKVNLIPGTLDIAEVFKPEEEPTFDFVTKKDIEKVLFEDVGGLWKEKERIKQLIELPIKQPELFKHLGLELPKGILFYGPPGCGKTLMAKAIANEINAYFIGISGGDIYTKWVGEPEERIGKLFEYAKKKAKEEGASIIFIDEIDVLAPKREETSEVERRVVGRLCKELDGLTERGKVIVIAATNRPDALDPALRRPGRFDQEIEFSIPDEKARYEILKIHTRKMRESGALDEDVDLLELSKRTHGYSGADLEYLCKEAAFRALPEVKELKNYKDVKVKKRHFEEALQMVHPSLLRELYIELPKVGWKDVGGLEEVKKELRNYIEIPLKHPEVAEHLKIERTFGVLLYGPVGCGKTLLAKALAGECGINFIGIKGPELYSKWVGESEKAVREIFKKARQSAPCIICIDEAEALLPIKGTRFDSGASENVVSQFLAEMSGLEELKNVYVILTSARPDLIDPGVIRSGRVGLHLYVPPPNKEARLEIYKIHTRDLPLNEDVNLEELASLEGYTGADIYQICEYAKHCVIEEWLEKGGDIRNYKISKRHFEKALEKFKPQEKYKAEKITSRESYVL